MTNQLPKLHVVGSIPIARSNHSDIMRIAGESQAGAEPLLIHVVQCSVKAFTVSDGRAPVVCSNLSFRRARGP